MAESRAERKARRALIEAAGGSEEKSSTKSKSSKAAKSKSAKSRAKTKRSWTLVEVETKRLRLAPSVRIKIRFRLRVRLWIPSLLIMRACGGCTALNRPYKKQLASSRPPWRSFLLPCEREGALASTPFAYGRHPGRPGQHPCAARFFAIRPPLPLLSVRRVLSGCG